jgi:hypothetical protein
VAETDILNPVKGWWDVLGDNPNWSYGWIRKTASNKSLARPRLGRRYSRETMNAGYSANLNWIDRPYSTVLYLKRFYEQFQGGYFTLIDRDGHFRHHVGNFTTEPIGVETANGKYTIQGLTFEECPQARMLEYPNRFDESSHPIYTVDDYLVTQIASQGAWLAVLSPAMAGTSLNAPSSYEMLNAAPVAGDFAQVEYVGWGFQMAFRADPLLGLVDIYVDGVLYIGGFDLSIPVPAGAPVWWVPASDGQPGRIQKIDMPLDKHRVKVVAKNAPGTASTASGAIFPVIQVMH